MNRLPPVDAGALRSIGKRGAVWTSLLPLLVGVARAHGGSPSTGEGHLVADLIGLLAFAFLVYIAYVLATDVLYPRVRDAWYRRG